MNKYINQLYKFRSNPAKYDDNELAIVIIKPNSTQKSRKKIINNIIENGLIIIRSVTRRLLKAEVIAIYNDIFRFNESDLLFGASWKNQKLEYMMSGESEILLIQGKNAQQKAENIKYEVRKNFGKLSVPDKKLDDKTFEDLAIKNIIHVVDADETDISLKLFFD